ncbi:hypothetical protein ACFVYC_06815 [Pseudarthrobacter sp. NPDC058329]|uniref:hypothetical protein n=1 Tax=Pseudarthrobacter sp. NPDC058329 TaxID=3346448 RepID=UPI0036DA4BEB
MGNGGGAPAAMEGIHASVAGLDVLFLEEAALDSGAGDAVDVLQRQYEIRLERMTAVKQLEAQLAAAKARDAAEALDIQHAITPPDAPVHERTYAEMSAVEEIAGVLTISSGAASAFISQSRQLCALPLARAALSAGTITWQHAKIIADETESLDPAGAKALVAHFFDPDAPNPARGAAAGELVPARFRAKVRTWRERHHPETLEKRHTKSAADRRMEYTPDRDGMAWISLHLPGDTACAIWNRTTALARGLQSPNEPRTMTQLRPDIAARLLLSAPAAGSAGTGTGDGVGDTDTGATAARNNPERDSAEGESAERAAANGPRQPTESQPWETSRRPRPTCSSPSRSSHSSAAPTNPPSSTATDPSRPPWPANSSRTAQARSTGYSSTPATAHHWKSEEPTTASPPP